MVKYLRLMLCVFAFDVAATVHAEQPAVLQTDEITVVYEQALQSAAEDIIRLFPKLRLELMNTFGWNFDIPAQVVLVSQNKKFQSLTGNEYFVAYAVPNRNLIVIDYTKMNIRPFTLEVTLKHELCHLFLHRHINNRNLPKWFDEGVCQWISDGVGELFIARGWSGLDAAVMAGRIIPFKRLTESFPRDRTSLVLAYEQSRSLINYLDRRYGFAAILKILDFLRDGESIDYAVMGSLAVSLDQLETEWREQLETTPRWLIFLVSHIYAILFLLAALLTMFGFIRLLIKRRRIYREWEEQEDDE